MKKISLFILVFTLFSILIFIISKNEKESMIKEHLASITKENIEHYNLLYSSYKKLSQIIFKTKIDTKEVKEIFKTAFISDDKQKKIIRQKLHNQLKDIYSLLKNYNIKQLHFHLPNNDSFLRFHKPSKYGDDLTNIRATVKYVNQNKKPIDGYEEGRIYSGYRFVFPLFENETHIGSVEVSFSAFAMSSEYMNNFNVISNFLILKSVADRKLFEEEKSNLLPTHFKKFYVEKEILENLKKLKKIGLKNHISSFIIDIVNQKALEEDSFALYDPLRDKIITFIKVKNPITQNVVGIFIVESSSKYISQIEQKYYFFLVIIISLLAILIYYVYTKNIYKDDMEESNKKLSSILQEANSGIALIKLNGDFLQTNKAYSRLLGYTQKEFLKLNCIELTITDKNQAKAMLKEALEVGYISKARKVCKTKEGKEIHLEFSLTLLSSKNAFIAVINSLDDKIELENLNKELEQIIEIEVDKNREKDKLMFQQSRLIQMGEMINMIAHQWRQPLNIISAVAISLNFKIELNKFDAGFFNKKLLTIINTTNHLSSTIDDFRDFFKPSKEKEQITYCEIVESVLEIVEESIRVKNIKIVKDLNYNKAFNTYANEVKQVILNLIKNAEEALLDKKVKEPYIKIRVFQENSTQILEISDNGGGVPEEIMDKIFEPYFSTKIQKEGTGLGLYMSKIIIDEHCGGKLTVFNDEFGAVFRIKLGDIL